MSTVSIIKGVLLVAAASLAVDVSGVMAATTIHSCKPVDQPGSYRLGRNITATEDDLFPEPSGTLKTCILIMADFVTLDLDGHTIVGPGTANTVGIGSFQAESGVFKGIKVHSGAVTNFAVGVFLRGFGHTVEGIRAQDNTESGIRVGVFAAAGHRIVGNVVTTNGFSGIGVDCPSVVLDNVVFGHTDTDIQTFFGICTRLGNSPAP